MSNVAQMNSPRLGCPGCLSGERQVKAGRNRAGSQRYLCRGCGRSYTPEPKHAGYGESVRAQALEYYAVGVSLREAAVFVGVNHQTVANWVKEACARARAGAEAGSLDSRVAAWREAEQLERQYRRMRAVRTRRKLRVLTF